MAILNPETVKKNRATAVILLADGKPFMRQVIGNALMYGGFRNLHLVNQVSALKDALAGLFPDLLIIDSDLPDGDATELVRKMRCHKLGRNPFLPIIMTSWRSDQALVRRVVDSGVDALLVKPFAAGQLFARIENLILDRKSFVVTTDYVGPDRRKRPREDDGDPSRLEPMHLAVPNTLKEKLAGRQVDFPQLRTEITDLMRQIREGRSISAARAIAGLVAEMGQDRPARQERESLATVHARLTEVNQIFAEQVTGTQFESLRERARALMDSLRDIDPDAGQLTRQQRETIEGLANAIRVGVVVEEAPQRAPPMARAPVGQAVGETAEATEVRASPGL